MADGYRYDLFVSYPNRGRIPEWVRDVLVPTVAQVLDEHLDTAPRIAFDRMVFKAGDAWPEKLADMHASSRAFLMVLAWPFFASHWCVSEWRNAIERARSVAASSAAPSIVVPIRYNDLEDEYLDRLPEGVRDEINRYMRSDFGPFTALVNPNGDNETAMAFRQAVERLCRESLCHAIEAAPPFRSDWPRLPHEPWSGRDPRWKSRL